MQASTVLPNKIRISDNLVLERVANVVACSPERAIEAKRQSPTIRTLQSSSDPPLVVVEWVKSDPTPPPLEGEGVFPVLRDVQTGAWVVLTDRVAIEFAKGIAEEERDAILHEFGLEFVRASKVLPHRVIARATGVAGASIEAATRLRSSKRVREAHADLLQAALRT